jgi:hypothetical protein
MRLRLRSVETTLAMVDLPFTVELLLNIFWLALTGFAVMAFLRDQGGRGEAERLPYLRALFALACIMVLLFPVVSASDDLHPTQAIFEDSSKRIQPTVTPVLHGNAVAGLAMLLAFLSFAILFGPLKLRPLPSAPEPAKALLGHRLSVPGRAPPSFR